MGNQGRFSFLNIAMHHLVKRTIVPLIYLLVALVVSSCSPSLSSLPFLNKVLPDQEKAEDQVERPSRFVRATEEPVAIAQGAEQVDKVEESAQVALSERIEADANALGSYEQRDGKNHEDKGMMPMNTEARDQVMPKQLLPDNPDATQAASRELDSETTEIKDAASAPKPEKVIRVHLASLSSESSAKREWRQLNESHFDLLDGVTPYIKEVNLRGKGTYFRLYVGEFVKLTTASAFCKAMKKRKQYCAPVALSE